MSAPESSAEPADPLIGVVLGETYRVERKLAEGGMGQLYEAFHLRLGMKVAVKTLHDASAGRAESTERAKREARAMANIASPYVARIFDVVPGPDGRPCLVTELLVGEDLAARLVREGKIGVRDAVRIARATAEGLAEAHRRGVLHRDIKPSNVFLTADGGVKLIDFGVAKMEAARSLTQAGAFLGTPAYMSPEQAAAASKVDERSDVYGLGAVLYRMLSGEPPYGDLDTTQTLTRLLSGDPPKLSALDSSVPEALRRLVVQALAPDAKDRCKSALDLVEGLRRFERDDDDPVFVAQFGRLRVRAILGVVGTAAVATLWSAALAFEVASAFVGAEAWPDWTLYSARAVPAVALALGIGSGARTVTSRWHSTPDLEALVAGLTRTVWIAAAALGVLSTLRTAAALFSIELGASEASLGVGALVVAPLLAATVAAVSARVARANAARAARRVTAS